MQDYERAAIDFAKKLADLKITVECAFVPFSASRNAGEKWPSLNWRCKVMRDGRVIPNLDSVDYMQGSGHCPAYRAGAKRFPVKADLQRAIALECETGRKAKRDFSGQPYQSRDTVAKPTAADILSALCGDASVIDYATYEDWAPELGFDPDSRKGEAIYRQCLQTALALRAAIGETELQALRDIAGEM